jgi:electron transport complex protein RnfA
LKFSVAEFFSLAVSAILVSNLVMIYLLSSNVFFKALKSPVSGITYGVLVTISTTVASMIAWIINEFIILKFGLNFLYPFAFIFGIIVVELLIELIFYKFFSQLRSTLGGLLPASAFNCAVLGLVLINVQHSSNGFLGTTFYGFCAGLGFVFALFVAASAMERVRFSTPPSAFKGLPIAFVTASLISLAFMGFSGIQIPY